MTITPNPAARPGGIRSLLRETVRRTTRPDGHGRGPLVAFGALAAADLAAVTRRPRGPARAAKPLLMPALAAHVLRRRPAQGGEAPTALVAGLACAAVGDAALLRDDSEAAFLAGMAAFLGTQTAYTAGMARDLKAVRSLRRRPAPALVCLAGWAAANAVLAPTLPPRVRLPAAGYSLALAAMGAAALGVGGKVGAGAVSFLASDLLIGLQAAGRRFPGQEVLVMAGYLAGQYLIVSGWPEAQEAAAG